MVLGEKHGTNYLPYTLISLKKGIKKQSALTENISIKTNCSSYSH